VVDAYLAAGHEVGVVDDLSTGTRENLDPRAQFWQVDIRSAELAAVLADFRPEVISHHAAQMSVSVSARDPRHDADVNILGTLNLLEAVVRNGVWREPPGLRVLSVLGVVVTGVSSLREYPNRRMAVECSTPFWSTTKSLRLFAQPNPDNS
jgi:hypothetical protein